MDGGTDRNHEARHPIGTKARLAIALFLYTGQRRSEVVQFGRHHIGTDDVLGFTRFRGRRRKPYHMASPALHDIPDLKLRQAASHTTSKRTVRYTVAAERAKMAMSGMAKLGAGRLGNKSVPTGNGVAERWDYSD